MISSFIFYIKKYQNGEKTFFYWNFVYFSENFSICVLLLRNKYLNFSDEISIQNEFEPIKMLNHLFEMLSLWVF